MAADRSRLAAALAYRQAEEERRRRMLESIPAPAGTTPGQPAPQADFRTNLENLSIGVGEGLTNQLEGIKGLVTDPIGTAKGVYEAGKAVVRDPAIIASALRQMGQKAMSGPLGAGEVMGEMIGPRKTGPVMAELDVYHGTPHRFPATEGNPLGEFDASKIGTGEGQQVYGHGIYLAEAQDVGDSYRRALTPHQVTSDAAQSLANYAVRQRREPEAAIQWLEKERKSYKETPPPETMKQYDDAIAILRQGNVEKVGNLYKADLPDEMIDRMLDWDKPLSEQHPEVQRIIGEEIKRIGGSAHTGERAYRELMFEARMQGKKSGSSVMKNNLEANEASKRLQELGIPGIKYLDAGSRGQGGGTRNFVVFPGEEKKVRILERDGQKAPPQKIAQALEAASTESTLMKRMRELYGDYAQAYNLGLPDTPEYRRIVQEVTAQGPLSDDALLEAVRAHPGLIQAGGKARASEMRQANRGGAAALVDSLTGQGIKTRVETSKSPGSRSTYIYASKGDNTVKIRLSDHLPAESGRVYGTNDIMTTPQHWKSAAKRALKLLEEVK